MGNSDEVIAIFNSYEEFSRGQDFSLRKNHRMQKKS